MRRAFPRLVLAISAVGTCLVFGGCRGTSDPSSLSLEQSVAAPQTPSHPSSMMALASASGAASPSQSMASLPPEAGTIVSVRGHDYVNGFRQDIMLKGSPLPKVANSITLLARTTNQSTLDATVPLVKPTEAAIRSEMGAQFPQVSMQVVERPSKNAYGPYGLALGRGAGTVHCIYMWQWIDENRLPRDAGMRGPVSVRVRLCQPDTSFDAMAALVDHLTVGPGGVSVAGAGESAGIVSAPTDLTPKAAKPKPKAKRVAAHRIRHPAEAKSETVPEQPVLIPQPAVVATAPSSTPPSMDLPPQAYSGPKAAASHIH